MSIAVEMAGKKPELQLYNSMTKEKEVFKPIVEGKVGMYICGVTSYDLSHIGHARAYVAFDVLYRFSILPFSFVFCMLESDSDRGRVSEWKWWRNFGEDRVFEELVVNNVFNPSKRAEPNFHNLQ